MKINQFYKSYWANLCAWVIPAMLVGFNSCSGGASGQAQAILTVEPSSLQESYPEVEVFRADTVDASSAIHAYAKGVQRYAAAWLYLGQEELQDTLAGVQIVGLQGEDIASRISQEQRDSVIMDFIKFARRSSIPYYEHIKDFDLKMMKIR